MSSSTPKIVLVTGGNTGLGLEIIKSLTRSPTLYTILLGCRDPAKGEAAIAEVQKEYPSMRSTLHVIQIDLSSDSSLEAAIATITAAHPHLDILINNSGASFDLAIQSSHLPLRDGFNKSWDTNVTGTHILTSLCIPLLLQSEDPRLIFMTSGTSSLIETEMFEPEHLKRINASPEKGWPKEQGLNPITSYRSTKAGLNMLMREWVRLLREDGVKVWAVSPGFLATGLAGVGAETLRKVSRHIISP